VDDNEAGQAQWTERGQAAVAALAETWGSLAESCHALVTREWELPTECPGWSVQDQLSHLIGVEQMVMGQPPPAWDGPPGEHVKNDFAALNEKWVAVRRHREGDAVLAEFNDVTGARLAQLAALSPDAWAAVGPSPVGEVPYARFMETRVFDSWVHEQDARRALDRPGGWGGLASGFGLGQVEAAMGFVVGKKAAAPDGSVVRFDVSGVPRDARCFSLGVTAGRAAPLRDGDDRSPTVSLSLSGADFVRLGCGRVTGPEALAATAVGVRGDAELAERILGAMNFMF
jgi:uncharacterized protein (TIGR03083 family)